MKKFTKLFGLALLAVVLASCAGNDDNGSTNDVLIGQWKQISEVDNGTTVTLNACDLTEVTEFVADGTFLSQDYDLVDGACVLDDPNAPGVTITSKWFKIIDNSYQVKFYINGNEAPLVLNFTAVFSDGNNKVTTTATEEDGNIVVAELVRIP